MKIILYILLFSLSFIAVSCMEETEKMEKQIVEACIDGDFDKARGIAAKMEVVSAYHAKSAIEYINDKEIYYLLAKPSRENDQRIIYLYNTFESDQLPDMNDVITVAISMDNANLPEKLIKAGVSPNEENAKTAINAEMSEIVDLIVSKKPAIILNPDLSEFYKKEFGEDKYKSVIQKASLLMKTKLEKKLQEIYSIKVPPRPATGLIRSKDYGDYDLPGEYYRYNSEVSDLHKEIIKLISEAVAWGHTDIATKALSYMKPTLNFKELGRWHKIVEHQEYGSNVRAYQVTENKSDIVEARKIIQNGK